MPNLEEDLEMETCSLLLGACHPSDCRKYTGTSALKGILGLTNPMILIILQIVKKPASERRLFPAELFFHEDSTRRDKKQMAGIRVRENEPFEVAVKRFRKKCEKAGILTELRRRERYEKPSVKRKKKALAAKKRTLKRMRKQGVG